MAGMDMPIEDKHDSIDRQKVCPFLLRVFVSTNGHHSKLSDFHKGNTPQNELQIYTWRDATLLELTQLVKEVNPEARRKGTKFDFAFVYPDPRAPLYRLRDVGSMISGSKGPDDLKTLANFRLSVGDYIDIAITQPHDTWNSGGRKGGYDAQRSYGNQRPRPY